MVSFASLAPFTFWGELSDSVLAELNSNTKLYSFNKGETIVHKGQMIGGAYLVQTGKLRIYTMDSNGNEKPIYGLTTGEICMFSINCILKKIAYPAWVTVDSEEANVISIPTSTFRHLYKNEPIVRDYVFNSMSQRIFDLMSSIEETSIYDLGYRINSYLVRSCPEDKILHISHQDIASSLGSAREVISRHLKQLEKSGYIKLSRMKIEILLLEALAKIPPNNAG